MPNVKTINPLTRILAIAPSDECSTVDMSSHYGPFKITNHSTHGVTISNFVLKPGTLIKVYKSKYHAKKLTHLSYWSYKSDCTDERIFCDRKGGKLKRSYFLKMLTV